MSNFLEKIENSLISCFNVPDVIDNKVFSSIAIISSI
jgi:hypothetical protein